MVSGQPDITFKSKMCVFDEVWNPSELQPPALLSQLNTHLSASPEYPIIVCPQSGLHTAWHPCPCTLAANINSFKSFPLSHGFLLITLSGGSVPAFPAASGPFPHYKLKREMRVKESPEAPVLVALKISTAVQSGTHGLSRECLQQVAELCTPA